MEKNLNNKYTEIEYIKQTPYKIIYNTLEEIIANYPLKGSNLIEKVGKLELYEYPKIEISEKEIKDTIKKKVIDLTGSGKTTFLNSYINYLIDINYSYNFQHKIINEVKKLNDAHFQIRN